MSGTPGGRGRDGEAGGVRLLRRAAAHEPLSDWGPITAPIDGASRTRGLLLHRDAGGFPEAGVWECTPGAWECRVARDEFCHFLAGRCVYTHESGARLEIAEGDTAWFPAGWNGRCEVIETVRKVYVIR